MNTNLIERVCVEVLGWQPAHGPAHEAWITGDMFREFLPPADGNLLLRVVEAMRAKGWEYGLCLYTYEVSATFEHRPSGRLAFEISPSRDPIEATFLAALRALEAEPETNQRPWEIGYDEFSHREDK